MSKVVLKKEIIKTSPISNTEKLSVGLENLTINDSNVIQTTTAKCILIGDIYSPDGEIFAVNPESIIEEKLSYDPELDDSWDTLITGNFAVPLIIPPNQRISVFGIYDSNFPYEYRVVIDNTQKDYYLGTGIESPYNNIRYVFTGYTDAFPNLILGSTDSFESYNTNEYIQNLISNRKILALNIDRTSELNEDEYTTVEVYAVYGSGLGSRIPIEYRLVFDVDRRNFYSVNSISENENYNILESENTERITSDGLPVVNRSFYDF